MNFVDVAQEYFDGGLNPLPLRKNKAPKLPEGHPFLYKKIDNLDRRFSDCEKIGIACGPISGGFYCFDFDKHQGQDIEPVFRDFISIPLIKHLLVTNVLVCFKTPGGGYHFYFRSATEIGGTCIARWHDGTVKIEIRGNGQYVATFPSEGYKQVGKGDIFKLDYIEPDIYREVLNTLRSFNSAVFTEKEKKKSDRKWPDKWDDNKPDGKFNNEQGNYARELLREAGWKLISTRRHDGVELWQRPGKGIDDGISATFGAKFNMFYNFSQNAAPFEEDCAYSPFNIYTILKFGGDWKKAKDSLKVKPVPEPDPQPAPSYDLFPVEVFPDQLREYIVELKKSLNFHPDFCAAAAMFAISTVNGNKYKLRVKNGWEASTVFWFACVGYPGTIKTHPVKTLMKPLQVLDYESKMRYDAEMLVYDPEGKQPKPKFRQHLISDYTLEALHSIHDINKRGIGLYKDELKGFLNDMNKYRKGSDEEFWLESFNNGSYIVNRVTREPIMVHNISINIIGTIQHDVLSKVVDDYAGNGLIDRFLFTASEDKVYPLTSEEISNYHPDEWMGLIRTINKEWEYRGMADTIVLDMNPETFKIYQQIDAEYVSMQNSENHSQETKNYLSKLKTYVPRFALLLGIMDSIFNGVVPEVTPEHMINAKKVADYFLRTASGVFSQSFVSQDIKAVDANLRGMKRNERITKIHESGFKTMDIARYFKVSRQYVSKVLNKG